MSRGGLVLYATEDGQAQFFLRAEGGTVWLSQLALAELSQTSVPNVNLHIKNVLAENELRAEAIEADAADLLALEQAGRLVAKKGTPDAS